MKTREGHFVPATPIEGSVLINVGDAMQRWTADRLVSTVRSIFHNLWKLQAISIFTRAGYFFGMRHFFLKNGYPSKYEGKEELVY